MARVAQAAHSFAAAPAAVLRPGAAAAAINCPSPRKRLARCRTIQVPLNTDSEFSYGLAASAVTGPAGPGPRPGEVDS